MADNTTSGAESFLSWASDLNGADFLGTLGVLTYVSAYFFLQIGFLKGDGYTFPLLNLLASAFILVSLSQDFNAYSATTEIAWSTISIIGLTRIYLVHRLVRLSEEESAVASILVHRLRKDRVRKLLKIGAFEDADAGTVIAEEGKPVPRFTVILDGRCRILSGGVDVATLGAGAMVGELTYATGDPATATVVVDAPTRLFQIDSDALRQFLARNPDIATEMALNSASEMRSKLSATTTRLSESQMMGGVGPAA